MKRIILAIIALLSVVGVVALPFGIIPTMENFQSLKATMASYESAKEALNTVKEGINDAKRTFDSSREFEVYYGDISRLKQLFDGLASISLESIYNCDASNYFAVGNEWQEGEEPSAVKFVLTAGEIKDILTVLSRMELPVYSLVVKNATTVEVIFLTGGAVQ